MTIAQVVLTTAESRKLIAHAISQIQPVRNALQRFKLIISTSFIAPDILEALDYGPIAAQDRGLYVCGMVRAKGLCTTDLTRSKRPTILERGAIIEDPEARMKTILSLGAGDAYIKSPNILDQNGRVGVLAGAVDCGEVGGIICGLETQDFSIIAPTLLLKSAPIDLTITIVGAAIGGIFGILLFLPNKATVVIPAVMLAGEYSSHAKLRPSGRM